MFPAFAMRSLFKFSPHKLFESLVVDHVGLIVTYASSYLDLNYAKTVLAFDNVRKL